MPRKRTGSDAACYYDGKLLGRCTKADSDAYTCLLYTSTGRGACREGTRHPGLCRTLSWGAFLTGSACSLWLLPGAVSVRYGPARLKKRPSP